MKAVEIKNLCYSYSDKKNVINNLNLEIENNEKIGVVGSNGAGKTTLFMLMGGVLKPNEGEIKIYNDSVQHRKYNEKIGFVFQNPNDQLFSPTVYDDLAFGLLNQGLEKSEIDKKINESLIDFGVAELKNRPTQHLSDGEKRKISLLSVSIMKPKILILDEPSSNLDMRSRREYINLLNKWQGTLIISSHDLEFIIETCDKTIIMDSGNIKAFDETKKVLSNETIMLDCHQEIPWSLR